MPLPVRQPPAPRSDRPRRIVTDAPDFKSVELAQRGRMILDVAEADLAASEQLLGPFHETSWYFRRSLADARNSWDRLRARYGLAALEAALEEPPATVLTLGRSPTNEQPAAVLVVISGKSYALHRQPPADDAPRIWRLTRLPPSDHGPIYCCRLLDGTSQCDCAEWTFEIADRTDTYCKHLAALDALGWI